ncbi:MAG: hypothetical protein ACRD2O_01670 [Terriglobia bacterium]
MRHPCKLAIFLMLLSGATAAALIAKGPETWQEIRSPHFFVIGQCKQKGAKRVAMQFEEIRAVFHSIFPTLLVDPPTAVYIILVKDKGAFNAISPKSWSQRGEMERSGYYLNGPIRNYVVVRLDVDSENPDTILYHEYTHLVLRLNMPHIPLWADEGLADFFGNTSIRQKDVMIGEPDAEYIGTLRQRGIIPLQTLFAVDFNSPYYNQTMKGSMFYAESWALVHYLLIQDRMNRTDRMDAFLSRVAKGTEPVQAASQAFGNLADLQDQVDRYIQKLAFMGLKSNRRPHIDPSQLIASICPPERVAAIRADILLHNQRYDSARAILDELLKDDPDNLMAKESLGYLKFYQKHYDAAKPLFAAAVTQKQVSYMTRYLYAFLCFRGGQATANSQIIQANLKDAIQAAPRFAPAYDLLASLYGFEGVKLDEARRLAVTAVELDPARTEYRITVANVLARMNQFDNAERVVRMALAQAKTQEDRQLASDALTRLHQIQRGVPTGVRE